MELITQAERTHAQALKAFRKAVRAGDIEGAQRWLKLAKDSYAAMEKFWQGRQRRPYPVRTCRSCGR